MLIKALIVYNPKSGNGFISKKINDICLYFKDYEVSVFHSNFEKEITSYLFLNSPRFDLVVILGGDGTLHEAINGIIKSNAVCNILYLPSGSVNDFAKHIGVKCKYKKINLEDFKLEKIDAYQIDDEYFIYTLGCGKFTNISYDKNFYFTKKYLKKFYYYFKLFKDLFKKHQYNLQIISNNIIYEEEVFMFLFLAINNVAGFRVRGLDNKINDGKITLYLLKYHKFLPVLSLLFFYIFKWKNKYFYTIIEGREFNISCNNLLNLNLDGEGPILKKEFVLKVIPNAINLYVIKN